MNYLDSTTTESQNSNETTAIELAPSPTPDTIGGLIVIKPHHRVGYYLYETIAYDSQTRVMYVIIDNGLGEATRSISPMYEPDGSLRTYDP